MHQLKRIHPTPSAAESSAPNLSLARGARRQVLGAEISSKRAFGGKVPIIAASLKSGALAGVIKHSGENPSATLARRPSTAGALSR